MGEFFLIGLILWGGLLLFFLTPIIKYKKILGSIWVILSIFFIYEFAFTELYSIILIAIPHLLVGFTLIFEFKIFTKVSLTIYWLMNIAWVILQSGWKLEIILLSILLSGYWLIKKILFVKS